MSINAPLLAAPAVAHQPTACGPLGKLWASRFSNPCLLVVYLIAASAFITWMLLLNLANFDQPADVQVLACNSVMFTKAACGLRAEKCMPLEQESFSRFFCPPRCNTAYNVVGTGVYRADSFTCTAAAHAGAISQSTGGVGLFRLAGPRPSFQASTAHGVSSQAFPSWFPRSVEFRVAEGASEPVWLDFYILLAVLLAFYGLIAAFRPSKPLLLACLLVAAYWYVNLVNGASEAGGAVSDEVATGSARMLELLALGALFYKVAEGGAMPDPSKRREDGEEGGLGGRASVGWRMRRWLGGVFVCSVLPFFLGANINDWLSIFAPVALDAQFLQNMKEHGAAAWLTVVLAAAAGIGMAVFLLKLNLCAEGRGRRVAVLAGAGVAAAYYSGFIVMLQQDYSFHLHHNTLAALALPLTVGLRVPGHKGAEAACFDGGRRVGGPLAACQAVLLGMFSNGFSRYGWAPTFDPGGSGSGGGGGPPPKELLMLENATDYLVVGLDVAYGNNASKPLGWGVALNGVSVFEQYFTYAPHPDASSSSSTSHWVPLSPGLHNEGAPYHPSEEEGAGGINPFILSTPHASSPAAAAQGGIAEAGLALAAPSGKPFGHGLAVGEREAGNMGGGQASESNTLRLVFNQTHLVPNTTFFFEFSLFAAYGAVTEAVSGEFRTL